MRIDVRFLSDAFSASFRWSYGSSYFVSMVDYIGWFLNVKPTFHLLDKPCLSCHILYVLHIVGFYLPKFCSFFFYTSIFIRGIVLCFYFLVIFFVWFRYQGNTGLIEWIGRCFFLFSFLVEFIYNLYIYIYIFLDSW